MDFNNDYMIIYKVICINHDDSCVFTRDYIFFDKLKALQFAHKIYTTIVNTVIYGENHKSTIFKTDIINKDFDKYNLYFDENDFDNDEFKQKRIYNDIGYYQYFDTEYNNHIQSTCFVEVAIRDYKINFKSDILHFSKLDIDLKKLK